MTTDKYSMPNTFPLALTEFDGLTTSLTEGVLSCTLNNPAAGNSLSLGMLDSLFRVLDAALEDRRIKVLLITGIGRNFCAGGDLDMVEKNIAACRNSKEEAYALQIPPYELTAKIEDYPKPVVAAVNGAAAGFGFSLALAADIIIAEPKTRFIYAFTQIGLTGDGGIPSRLVRRIGLGRALETAMFSQPIDADKALNWGLVNFITDAESELSNYALHKATQLAKGPATALREIKRCMYAQQPITEQKYNEIDAFITSAQDDDILEGIKAIREKRPPVFK